jgi:hypothetical protein
MLGRSGSTVRRAGAARRGEGNYPSRGQAAATGAMAVFQLSPICLEKTSTENVCRYSLTFQKAHLEEYYRCFQFDLVRESYLGRFGTLSIITILALLKISSTFIEQGSVYLERGDNVSFWRLVSCMPFLVINGSFQWIVHTGQQVRFTQKVCTSFITAWIVFLSLLELSSLYISDALPDRYGDSSFSSSYIIARGVTEGALMTFHLTAFFFSFLHIVQFVLIKCLLARIIGIVFIWDRVDSVGIWSLSESFSSSSTLRACVRGSRQYSTV